MTSSALLLKKREGKEARVKEKGKERPVKEEEVKEGEWECIGVYGKLRMKR